MHKSGGVFFHWLQSVIFRNVSKKFRVYFLALLSSFLFLWAPAVQAVVVYVDVNATGANTGTSWANAYTDFQDGIDNAVSGDEVWVAAGVYVPDSAPNIASPANSRYYHFSLKNGVAVYGGFAGTESSLSERDFMANDTVLSGDLGAPGDYSDNCYHVFYHPNGVGLTSSARLDGFIITYGHANGSEPHDDGGGMYNHVNSPTIAHCLFENNWAQWGGAIRNWASSPIITECLFENNIAMYTYGWGGAIYNQDGAPVISSCSFYNNQAKEGGAIKNYFSSPNISGCTFAANDASASGGGINNAFSPATITNCTFSDNTLSGVIAYEGGAILNYHGVSTVTNCTMSNNAGYAFMNYSCESSATPTPIITNSILWGSQLGEIALYSCYFTASVNVTYSVVTGGYTGTGNTGSDPLLNGDGLQYNGGPVETIAIGPTGSAVNAGTTTGAPATDARGVARDAMPDIGAYELVAFDVTPSVSGGNGTISPATVQSVPAYDSAEFTLTPNTGYHVASVTGTCGGTLVGNTFTTDAVTADCTVIASFAINTYTVNSSVSGGNGTIDPSGDQTVDYGATPAFTLTPNTGYHIASVTGTCGGALVGDTYTTSAVTADCTVIASFAINTYTVNSSVDGGNGTIAPSGDQTVNYGTTPAFTLTPSTGYHVDQVTGTCGGTLAGNTFTANAVTADCTVIASFAINTYTVNSSVSGGNGTIDPSGDQTVDYGATPAFTLTPDTGFHIEQVTGTCGGSLVGNTFTTNAVTADCTVIATFSDTYTVTSSVSGGNGTINPSGQQIVNYNDTPSFTLMPDTGYHIDQVTGTCGGTLTGNTFTTNPITMSCTVIASFAINTYTVNSSIVGGNGTIDPAGDVSVNHGNTQGYTLYPAAGYHVDEVAGTCGGILAGNSFTTNAITADCTVIGSFIDTYTLQVVFAGNGSGTVTSAPAGIDGCTTDCSAEFADGLEVILHAAPADKSRFAGWSGDGCSGTGDCTVTMDQARNITATFQNAFNWNLFLPVIIMSDN